MYRKTNNSRSALALVTVLCLLPATLAATPLEDTEADGYLQWQHSLEKAVQGRKAAEKEEGNLLYPFDLPGWTVTEVKPYRHLSIGKAILELESQWGNRQDGRMTSSLVALANARNYVNLSEYDSSLVWYQMAAKLDTAGNFRREIGRESLAAAIAANDSLKTSQLLTNTLGATELIGRELEIILGYRWLLAKRDAAMVDLFIQKVEANQAVLSDRLRYWHAYALAWRQDRDAALTHLRKLIRSGGLSRDLTEGQRAWVLVAIPDLLFLNGEVDASADLYRVLSTSQIDNLSLWATYQLANLDYLEGRYLKAGTGFKKVCDAKRVGSWQDQACELNTLSQELQRIKSEGERYGAATLYVN